MDVLREIKNRMSPIVFAERDVEKEKIAVLIEAEHQGLRVHQMAGYNEEKVKKALGCPKDQRVIVVFALGYEGSSKTIWDKLEQRIKDKLAEPRTRKSPNENFLFCSFGNSSK
jgi:hypothetical protein